MVLLVIDTQELITNNKLYHFQEFERSVKTLLDAAIKCGFEHGFKMIVPANTNATFDNAFMTGEQTYKYLEFPYLDIKNN
mgnify:CR=1 FL=1